MNVGVAMILLGVMMMVMPLLEGLTPLPDLLNGFGAALRSAWPATRDDGQMDDVLAKLEEVE